MKICKFPANGRLVLLAMIMAIPGGCAALDGNWPDLTSVPSRATVVPESDDGLAGTAGEEAGVQSPGGGVASTQQAAIAEDLDRIQRAVESLSQRLETVEGEIRETSAVYETSLLALTPGEVPEEMRGDWNTAQLYLSRTIRARDRLGALLDEVTALERALLDDRLKAGKISGSPLGLKFQKTDQNMAVLKTGLEGAARIWNKYVDRELNRLAVLSTENIDEASGLSFPVEGREPLLVVRLHQKEMNYQQSLKQVVTMVRDRNLDLRFGALAVGKVNALGDKNTLLLEVMHGLLREGVSLEHITLGIARDNDVEPIEVRLYVESL